MRKSLLICFLLMQLCFCHTTISVATSSSKKIYKKGWIDLNKNGKKDIYEDPNANLDERIEDLLSQMTSDEKTAQMVTLYGYGRVLKDDLPKPEWKESVWKNGIGAIDEHLNGFVGWGKAPSNNEHCWPASNHAVALNKVQQFFIEETRLGIPVDFTNEGIRGIENYIATNFPTQLAIGQTWNRDLVRKIGLITGKEARVLGYTNVYAPILDVARDQRWGRMEEVYGESPYLVAELGIEMTKGLQHENQVAATAKHFAIYSANKGAREGLSRVDPQVPLREAENIHLYPFRRVIQEAGLLGVMSSYNDYDGIPIQSSYYYLTHKLRKEYGFKGYVVSDSDAVVYLSKKHKSAENYKEAVRQSVDAGLNVRCTFRSPESFLTPLRELITEGELSDNVIDDRVRDILRVKFLIGLFDAPYVENTKEADSIVNCKEHNQVALQASRESIVLLKNDSALLPLDISTIKRISVCGPNAAHGDYALTHYGPLAGEVVTVLDGIQKKVGNTVVVSYTKGCNIVDSKWPDSEVMDMSLSATEIAEIEKAKENAAQSDVAIVVVGGSQRTCGENKSRTSLNLPGRQKDLIKAVQSTGKPTIVVVISGRPLTINWTKNNVPAILQAFYPGSQGGTAIAEVLFGDYNPGGKLTVTIPKTVGQLPFNFPTKPNAQINAWGRSGLNGKRARVNGYLYEFGYGLSYTQFKYSNLSIKPAVIKPGESVHVSVDVSNVGKLNGDEVVQLYIRDLVSSVTTYEKSLRGFERVHLKKGETKTVHFEIKSADIELIDKSFKRVIEPGGFNVMIGASSEDIRVSDTFTVADSGSKMSASTKGRKAQKEEYIHSEQNADELDKLFDNNTATGWHFSVKQSVVDFDLIDHANPNEIDICWLKDNQADCRFEIQLSGGGGQFITVYEGKCKASSDFVKYKFNGFPATDLRIICYCKNFKSKGIAEIRFKEFKGNK
ncbi:beta-glucosidase [Puteibacter caeruleilacunae]|nr:beta-glucosidase [Puteibacter caeruleilacunae]